MEKGGRGLMLIDLEAKDTLAGAAAYTRSVKIEGIGRGGKERDETLEIRSLNNARAARGRKGKAADLGFKPTPHHAGGVMNMASGAIKDGRKQLLFL